MKWLYQCPECNAVYQAKKKADSIAACRTPACPGVPVRVQGVALIGW